jgi:hypothetical protein
MGDIAAIIIIIHGLLAQHADDDDVVWQTFITNDMMRARRRKILNLEKLGFQHGGHLQTGH